MKNIFIILFLIPCYLSAQDAQLEKYIDSLMGNVNRLDMPGTMLLVAKDGKPIIKKVYGMANLELQVAARPDHLFAIGSVSKQFTVMAILQLASQGKLNLTDDIRKHLPGYNTHGKLITIEHLLAHTSGIPSEQKDYLDFRYSTGISSENEFLEFTMKDELLFDPGSDWSYCSSGYSLAAIIIEKISGISFQEYMATNIFQPAGMINSFVADEIHPLKNTVSSYFRAGDGKWMYYHQRLWSFAKGRGGIISSMDDMLQWDIALRQEKLLPKVWLEKAWTARTLKDGRSTDYGFGWTVSKNNELRFLTHGGVTYGSNTYSVHVPEINLYLLCANFYSASADPQNILKKIVSRMLNLSYPMPAETMIPISDYAGVYQMHRADNRITSQIADIPVYMHVSVSGDTLYMQNTAEEKTYLRPAGKDIFVPARSEDSWYIFSRDANAKVVAVSTKGSFWNYGPHAQNKRVNIQCPAPKEAKLISADLLKKYVGTYFRPQRELSPFYFYFIETDGVKLYNKSQGRLQELIPVANNKFVRKGAEDIGFEFKSAANGTVVLTVSGLRSFDYRKIN